MLTIVKDYWTNFVHLFFPHTCIGCNADIMPEQFLCTQCLMQLPQTGFFEAADNPVEQSFYGRVAIDAAAAAFYFTKQSLVQQLLFQLKYKGRQDVGVWLGQQIGHQLNISKRFQPIDAIIPLPLHSKKEKLRGYNQSTCIAKGIAEVLQKPVYTNVIVRNKFTETQTQKNRVQRWENMNDAFSIVEPAILKQRNILLVDDVITTGATLEACANALLSVPVASVQIATAAYTIL